MTERELQDQFDAWLREKRVPFRRDRMDKATTGTLGWPDFTIIVAGRALLIETKVGKGTLSARQQKLHRALAAAGTVVKVCRTLAECRDTAEKWLYGYESSSTSEPLRVPMTGEFEGTWQGKPCIFRHTDDGGVQLVRLK